MRRPLALAGIDAAGGQIELHIEERSPAETWLAGLHPGDELELFGPLGQTVRLDPRTRHVLLIAPDAAVASLRPMAQAAIAGGKRVALLTEAGSAAGIFPSSLLPDEVEYAVATRDGSLGQRGSLVDLMPAYEGWADQAIGAGPSSFLGELARLARGRDRRLGVARLGHGRRSWLSVLLPQMMGCALGVCLGCAVEGRTGPVRVCREGPIFDADDLAWAEPM